MVDEFSNLEINIVEQLLNKNRDLKNEISILQNKTCKSQLNGYVGRPEEMCK